MGYFVRGETGKSEERCNNFLSSFEKGTFRRVRNKKPQNI
jgi:hypothetical protein